MSTTCIEVASLGLYICAALDTAEAVGGHGAVAALPVEIVIAGRAAYVRNVRRAAASAWQRGDTETAQRYARMRRMASGHLRGELHRAARAGVDVSALRSRCRRSHLA